MAEQRVTAYEVVTASTADKLDERVSYRISDGWEPLGGVAFAMQGFGEQWAQAMVKRDDGHG